MITIIITALVSVLTTLVVGYFIWSGISVRKLKKQVKENKKGIVGNTEYTKHIEELLFNKENEIFLNLEERSNEIYKRVDDGDIELHKELDRRFDKVYQTIGQQKQ